MFLPVRNMEFFVTLDLQNASRLATNIPCQTIAVNRVRPTQTRAISQAHTTAAVAMVTTGPWAMTSLPRARVSCRYSSLTMIYHWVSLRSKFTDCSSLNLALRVPDSPVLVYASVRSPTCSTFVLLLFCPPFMLVLFNQLARRRRELRSSNL